MTTKPRFRLLPMPNHSFLLLIVWLLLNNTIAPGHLVLGTFLAVLIPLITAGMQNPQPRFHKPLTTIRYILMVIGDIISATFEVAL
jgi:multicomponent K+:H+ antiporter subunit E